MAAETAERRPFLAANWKMHKTVAEAEAFVAAFLPRVAAEVRAEVFLCPPFLALQKTVEACRESPAVSAESVSDAGGSANPRVKVAAQTMHEEREGAFTGEVSAAMLLEIGVHGVILGHSERRELFGETDRALQHKVPAALAAGLTPILCVGETEEERDASEMERKLRYQVQEDLEQVPVERLAEVVIAYEPIWAIGTGRTATPEQAQEAVGFVRALVGDRDRDAAAAVRILYGGSVKPENAAELLGQPDIDGALVGGASLDPEAFAEIVTAA